MIIGAFYLTDVVEDAKGAGRVFRDVDELSWPTTRRRRHPRPIQFRTRIC